MRRHNQLRQCQSMRCAAHIFLHQPHAGGGFDIQTTTVERNALAHNRDTRVARVAPFQFNQARRMFTHGRLANGVDERIARFQCLTGDDSDVRLVRFCDALCLSLQRIWPKVARWPIDEIAHQSGCSGLQYGQGNAGGLAHQQDPRSHKLRLAQIFMVTILPKYPAEHSIARIIIGKPICAFGKAVCGFRKMPHTRYSGIRNASDYRPFTGFISGQYGYIIRISFKLLRLNGGSGSIGLKRKPGFKTAFVGDMDQGGGLFIVRLDQIVITHIGYDSRNGT